jgi:hypothetical protein
MRSLLPRGGVDGSHCCTRADEGTPAPAAACAGGKWSTVGQETLFGDTQVAG